MSQSAAQSLADLQDPETYRAARLGAYPSPQSLQWAMRAHRKQLIDAGAMTFPNGRWLINPGAFDSVMLRVGAQRAMNRARG